MKSQVTIKELPKSEIELTITLPWEEVSRFIERAARDYSQNHPIKGFRPGHAPVSQVEAKMGSHELLHRAAEMAVKESYVKAVIDNRLDVIGPPQVELDHIHKNEDFTFKAVASVIPKIELPDLREIKVAKPEVKELEPSEKELADSLVRLQKMRAAIITVNRSAKEGDRVEIDFKLSFDKVPYEGGSSINHPVIIGEKQMLAEFEKQLVGMKANETKTFELTFPADYYDEKLRNRKGEMEVKMKLVQSLELPELSDEFAKNIGKFENVEALKKSMMEGLKAEKQRAAENKAFESLFEQIAAGSKAEIPSVLIEEEKHKMFHELEENVARIGLPMNEYLNRIKKSKEELVKEWDKDAEKRIMISLAIREIARKESLNTIDAKDVKNRTDQIMEELKNFPNHAGHADPAEIKRYAENLLIQERVIQWLKKEILKF